MSHDRICIICACLAFTAVARRGVVLLLGTQVCDELDFVAMDDFQKQFFLLRQDEWMNYKENFSR